MQDNKKFGVRIWKWLTITMKWFWLLSMFILGLAAYGFLPFAVFEYSYSLSELDLIETLFMVLLVMFVYHYIKLCRRINAPFIRKLITPWVHQAHLLLAFFFCAFIAVQLFKLPFDDLEKMPFMDFLGYVLMSVTLLYSYKRMNAYPPKVVKNAEPVTREGALE